MPDWDENSHQLQANLDCVFKLVEASALARDLPDLSKVKTWHMEMMQGLSVPPEYPAPEVRGNFRGDPAYPRMAFDVRVGPHPGVRSDQVARELASFIDVFAMRIAALDAAISTLPQTEAEVDNVLEVAAWAHAEWVRIHPFGNGNGRTARFWANWVLLRFRLPPFVTPRPRPGGDYGNAGAAAMQGHTQPTHEVFRKMLDEWVAKQP